MWLKTGYSWISATGWIGHADGRVEVRDIHDLSIDVSETLIAETGNIFSGIGD